MIDSYAVQLGENAKHITQTSTITADLVITNSNAKRVKLNEQMITNHRIMEVSVPVLEEKVDETNEFIRIRDKMD